MKLPPINLTTSLPTDSLKPEMVPSAVRSWQVGQILNATVVSRPNTQTATLRFGANDIDVQTRIPLSPGDLLKVRVSTAESRIVLRLVTPDSAADAARSEALRTALPRQQSLTRLLANLSQILTPQTGTPAQTKTPPPPLPPQIHKLAKQLMEQLPEAQRAVVKDGIRQAVQNSGTFTETRLAQSVQQGKPPPQGDTKLNLVRLLTTLQTVLKDLPKTTEPTRYSPLITAQTAPPLRNQAPVAQPRVPPSIVQLLEGNSGMVRLLQELIVQTEGALARVQVGQLSSLGSQEGPTQVWIAEVPLRFGQQTDLIQFRIEHHRGGGGKGEEYWSITFAFELEELGPVRARVVFFQEELSATLWAERESTAKKFKERLEELRKRIEKRGLSVKSVDCHSGIPEEVSVTPTGTPLISERA